MIETKEMKTLEKVISKQREGKVINKDKTKHMSGNLRDVLKAFPGYIKGNRIALNENNVGEIEIEKFYDES